MTRRPIRRLATPVRLVGRSGLRATRGAVAVTGVAAVTVSEAAVGVVETVGSGVVSVAEFVHEEALAPVGAVARDLVEERVVPAAAMTRRGTREIVADWRRFITGRAYRPYLRQSAFSGMTQALSGGALALPLLLVLGASPALATALMIGPLAGPALQVFMPTVLRRFGGRMRLITTLLIGVGQTVGLWVAPLLLGVALLDWPPVIAMAAVAVSVTITGIASGVGYGNLGVWYHIVLPEPERRFVAPRAAGIAMGVSALVLLPMAVFIDALTDVAASAFPGHATIAIVPFALCYAAGGIIGLLELGAVRRFPSPGRVRPSPSRGGPRMRPEIRSFFRESAFASFGAGLAPYMSVYAIAVLHTSTGYALMLSALISGVSIVVSSVAAAVLTGHSSSRMLRVGYVLLAVGYAAAAVSHPSLAVAPEILLGAAALVAAGGAVTRLSINERLFRMIGSADAMTASGRFLGVTAGGTTVGQAASVGVMATLPVAYPVYAGLFAASGIVRTIAAFVMDVSPTWNSKVNERLTRRALTRAIEFPDAELLEERSI